MHKNDIIYLWALKSDNLYPTSLSQKSYLIKLLRNAIKTFSSKHLTLIDSWTIKWTSFVAPKALFFLF